MRSRPLLVVGIDAGIGGLLLEEAAAGRLPTVASLLARGAHACINGPDSTAEFGYWTTLFTGSRLGEHGAADYHSVAPGSYRFETVPVHSGRGWMWEPLATAGRRVAVVDVPRHSVDVDVNATQVCSWGVHNGAAWTPPATHPPELLSTLEAHVPRPSIPRDHFEPEGAVRDREHAEALRASVVARGQLLRWLVANASPDVLVAVFSEAHTAAHRLWPYHRRLPEFDGSLHDELRAVYRAIDGELGTLVEALPDANVVLLLGVEVTDAAPVHALMEQFCTRLGYRVPQAGRRRPIDVARALIPERLRAQLARALPTGSQQRLMIDALENGTDWSATTLFLLPAPHLGQLRVNLRGRDPQGIVEAGADYEQVLWQATQDLLALCDARTGEPVIANVARMTDDAGGPPDHAPDLIATWRPHGALIERVRHPRADLTQSRPGWMTLSGHGERGLLVAAGPDVTARGERATVDPLDVAPTLLALAGAEPPRERPGRARTDLIRG